MTRAAQGVVDTANMFVLLVADSLLVLKIVAAAAQAWSFTDTGASSRKLDVS